ncbi:membrane protein [Thiosulfatimonas sediminis]|uniref:Membrane protein n=1 Tax=Thiosulfatimonas sediminis TaxID=2675054 RepID=A0A6F8PRF2_9GAMM|nr:efflux RND transporter periplasmic adaptor subunit [Thiosulfatimonas sediminis]BBP44712.1 membrane protein [Thiosulfatimonas sediminis]
MKNANRPFLHLLLCTFLLSAVYTPTAFAAEDEQAQHKQPAMPVQVDVVQAQNFPYQTRYPAQLAASKSVQVHARVSGIIEKQFYQEGQTVKAGDKLYQIDDRRYVAAVEQAKARLKSSEIQVNQNKINYERINRLHKQGSVSVQDVDDAFTAWQTSQADRDAAKAQLLAAQIDLDDTLIKAEIGGIIGERQMDVGDLVSPEAGITLLNTITNTDPLYANFAIADSERQTLYTQADAGLVNIFPQPRVALLNAQGEVSAAGKIEFIDAQLDAQTASQMIRASFNNDKQRLLPGQYVRLQVTLGEWREMLSVPEAAIMQVGAQAFVYVAENGTAQMKPVQLAAQFDKRWLVKSGLKAGDQVIVGNLIKLRPQTPVSVLPPANDVQPAGGK